MFLTGGHLEYGSFLGIGGLFASGDLAFVIDFLIMTAMICAGIYVWGRATGSDPTASIRSALIVMAAIAVVLVLLGVDLGMQPVRTDQWGGLLVTLVIAVTGIAASLPLGIVLALGRRSHNADRARGVRRLHRVLARRAADLRAVHVVGHAAAVPS